MFIIFLVLLWISPSTQQGKNVIFFSFTVGNVSDFYFVNSYFLKKCQKLYLPCPFGLIKRLDPVVVIFFKKCQKKITSVGSSAFQKNLQRLDQPTLVIFFGNEKILISKKNTTMGFKWCLDPIVVIFFEIKIFSFPKKITRVG